MLSAAVLAGLLDFLKRKPSKSHTAQPTASLPADRVTAGHRCNIWNTNYPFSVSDSRG